MGAANSQVDAATWQMPLMSGAVCGIAAAQTISAFPASSKIILFELGLPTAIGKRVQRGQPGTLMILDLDGSSRSIGWASQSVRSRPRPCRAPKSCRDRRCGLQVRATGRVGRLAG